MKNLKKLFPLFIMAVIMSATMTSCLSSSDDDDSVLTPEQESQYRQLISGTYYGNTYYYNTAVEKNKSYFYNDSIEDMTLRVKAADSTMVLESVPVKLFFKMLKTTKSYTESELNNLSDSEKEKLTRNEAIQKAAEEKGVIDMKLAYMLSLTPSNGALTYYVSPYTIEFTLDYQEAKHEMAIVFMSYTPAQWYSNKNAVVFFETAIYDGKVRNTKTGKDEYQLLDGQTLYNDNMTTDEQSELMFEFYGQH